MSDLDPTVLRATYDAQLRPDVPARLPAGGILEHDGPLVRLVGMDRRGFITYRDLAGLTGDALDALIARQRDYFAARGEAVEWKQHEHDRPADLADRLVAAGFVPEERETVVVGLAQPLAAASLTPPEGVHLREVTDRADLDRIGAMESIVWSEQRQWLAGALEKELAADPSALTVVVAEADGGVVCAGWVRYVAGTEFATLWGGSTLPHWRGKGIYKAVVAYRARLAVERGYSYLQVDASEESRPILQRLGFVAVTATTPYVFTPEGAAMSLTDDEKSAVKNAAYGAVFLVSNADPGFFSMIKESFAASMALAATKGLVHEVLAEGGLPSVPKAEPAELAGKVLPELAQAVTLLREKAPTEVAPYTDAVLAACDKVARATHGVSAAESLAIAQIKEALGRE